MSLFRLPEPLSRDARCETGVLPPHPTRERDLLTCPPHEHPSDASLRRREEYRAAVVLAAAVSLALIGTVWAGALTGDASHGEALYEACQDCHSLDKNDVGPRHRGVFGRKAAWTLRGADMSTNENSRPRAERTDEKSR